MRRRGRPGWPRWLVGTLAGMILFAVSGFGIGLIASASTSVGAMSSAARPQDICLPILGCVPTPTPSPLPTSVPPLPTTVPPLPTCLLNCGGPTPCVLNCGGPTPCVLNCGGPTPCVLNCGGPTPCVLNCSGPTPCVLNCSGPTPCVLGCVGPPGCVVGCGPGNSTPAPGSNGGSGTVPPGSPGGGGTNGTGGSLFGSLTGHRIADPAAGGTTAGIDPAAPAALALTSPGAGLSFGKAPYLWPLFIGLDVLAIAAAVFVLRKTWLKPVAD